MQRNVYIFNDFSRFFMDFYWHSSFFIIIQYDSQRLTTCYYRYTVWLEIMKTDEDSNKLTGVPK